MRCRLTHRIRVGLPACIARSARFSLHRLLKLWFVRHFVASDALANGRPAFKLLRWVNKCRCPSPDTSLYAMAARCQLGFNRIAFETLFFAARPRTLREAMWSAVARPNGRKTRGVGS